MTAFIKRKLNFLFKLVSLFNHKERMQFLVVLIVSLFMAFFQAIGIASVLPFVNMVMDPGVINENEWLKYFFDLFNFQSNNSFIVFSGFIVLGLLVIGNLISSFATWLRIHFVWRKNHNLSNVLLGKYLFMPYTYFLNQNTADLSKNVLIEVQQLTISFILPLISIICDSIVTIIILILLLYVNTMMTLIAAAVLILLYFLIYFYFSDKLKLGGKKRLQKNKERYKSAAEALGGIKDIKVLGIEKFFLNRFSKHSDEFSNIQSWYQVIGQIPRYAMEMVAFGGVVVLVIFLVYFNKPTKEIIPLVSFFAFAGYRLMPALQEIFNSLTSVRFHGVILDKIHEDINKGGVSAQNILFKTEKSTPISFEKEIELKNIYFSYPNKEKAILKNISLNIKKNTFIALIGPTGSGKTTLIDLMLGLFIQDRGSFEIDGVRIKDENIKNWQANLGYVPQQIYLSDDTVARNIAFGIPDEKIDFKQIEKVSKMACLHDFIIKELPEGYNTFIGERGIRLSGGQRQRIGIARALYHDPQVLILDEATSSLDNTTEKEVLDAIEGLVKIKTMIVIAHRLTTVKNCDKVYLMEGGTIVKEGSYNKIVSEKN